RARVVLGRRRLRRRPRLRRRRVRPRAAHRQPGGGGPRGGRGAGALPRLARRGRVAAFRFAAGVFRYGSVTDGAAAGYSVPPRSRGRRRPRGRPPPAPGAWFESPLLPLECPASRAGPRPPQRARARARRPRALLLAAELAQASARLRRAGGSLVGVSVV